MKKEKWFNLHMWVKCTKDKVFEIVDFAASKTVFIDGVEITKTTDSNSKCPMCNSDLPVKRLNK